MEWRSERLEDLVRVNQIFDDMMIDESGRVLNLMRLNGMVWYGVYVGR